MEADAEKYPFPIYSEEERAERLAGGIAELKQGLGQPRPEWTCFEDDLSDQDPEDK